MSSSKSIKLCPQKKYETAITFGEKVSLTNKESWRGKPKLVVSNLCSDHWPGPNKVRRPSVFRATPEVTFKGPGL
jgi:hypothetical protein